MPTYLQVIIFSLIGGVFSLLGAIFLFARESTTSRAAHWAAPFAAGALLGAVFIDLLPEANHEGDIVKALYATLGGILVFFFLERYIHWFHRHESTSSGKQTDPKVALIILGDTLHNFIDGIAIASGFLIDPITGVIVTLAVAAHEIPQEIGDFGLLLDKGMRRKHVFLVNILSALATTFSAVLFYALGTASFLPLDIVLGLVSGFFIYIAVSDIIPSIHAREKARWAGPSTLMLVAGVTVVTALTFLLHGIIE